MTLLVVFLLSFAAAAGIGYLIARAFPGPQRWNEPQRDLVDKLLRLYCFVERLETIHHRPDLDGPCAGCALRRVIEAKVAGLVKDIRSVLGRSRGTGSGGGDTLGVHGSDSFPPRHVPPGA